MNEQLCNYQRLIINTCGNVVSVVSLTACTFIKLGMFIGCRFVFLNTKSKFVHH